MLVLIFKKYFHKLSLNYNMFLIYELFHEEELQLYAHISVFGKKTMKNFKSTPALTLLELTR